MGVFSLISMGYGSGPKDAYRHLTPSDFQFLSASLGITHLNIFENLAQSAVFDALTMNILQDCAAETPICLQSKMEGLLHLRKLRSQSMQDQYSLLWRNILRK